MTAPQLVEKVANAIHRAIDADRLVLPTMPEMALKVREVADDPNAGIRQLAEAIQHDAALTTRIIRVANSALYRGAQPIADLHMALMRLGMGTTCTLATGLAMEQMFQATSDMVDRRLRRVWSLSAQLAGTCAILCKHCLGGTGLQPEQAGLAGLVHKIGVLPILAYAEEHPALLKDSITLDAIIDATCARIGVQILTRWDFPVELRQVPQLHLDFTRQRTLPDYADIVTVALLQAEPERYSELDLTTVTAFSRLGLAPAIETSEIEGLADDIAEAQGLFS